MASTTYDFPLVVKKTEDFSPREKTALNVALGAAVGKVALCTADEVVVSTTTLTNSTVRVNGLKAGKLYLVRAVATMTNATTGNGGTAALDLQGTQTTALFAGTQIYGHTFTTPTLVPAILPVTPLADAAASGASGTGSGPTSVIFEGFVQPQNDGDLILQTASAGGATAQTLKAGSFLQVTPLNPARSQ